MKALEALFHAAYLKAGVVTYRRKFANPHCRKRGPGRRHWQPKREG